ncbi:hypothetical protein [Actinoallomurus sp. CA-142502]|uniref:hypothetical protein n=1 Tax=Actinoallomurus sp. CA-142502 TaxID=3239885 RepID=UPI003D91271B
MAERLTPNPYSPYADADPATRHLLPSLLGARPKPGGLCPAACGGLAVVPEGTLGDITDLINEGRTAELPPGFCLTCLAVATGREPEPPGTPGVCRECGERSSHGDLCALCRQDLHDAWWPTREQEADRG